MNRFRSKLTEHEIDLIRELAERRMSYLEEIAARSAKP